MAEITLGRRAQDVRGQLLHVCDLIGKYAAWQGEGATPEEIDDFEDVVRSTISSVEDALDDAVDEMRADADSAGRTRRVATEETDVE